MSTTADPGASPLDYQSPQKGKSTLAKWLLRIAIAGIVFVGGINLLLPNLCKSSETANKAKCASNLHQIGLAIGMYAADNGGRYPDSFATLMRSEQLTSAVFVCPSSNDETADGDTQDAVIANMARPHHLSYVYLGAGLTSATVTDQTLVAYELPENHQGDGMNMLFGDGHCEWESMAIARQLIPSTQPTPLR